MSPAFHPCSSSAPPSNNEHQRPPNNKHCSLQQQAQRPPTTSTAPSNNRHRRPQTTSTAPSNNEHQRPLAKSTGPSNDKHCALQLQAPAILEAAGPMHPHSRITSTDTQTKLLANYAKVFNYAKLIDKQPSTTSPLTPLPPSSSCSNPLRLLALRTRPLIYKERAQDCDHQRLPVQRLYTVIKYNSTYALAYDYGIPS